MFSTATAAGDKGSTHPCPGGCMASLPGAVGAGTPPVPAKHSGASSSAG